MEDLFFEEQPIQTESIDLMKYVRGVLRRWWLVLGITVLVCTPWYIYLKKQPPLYRAEAWLSFETIPGTVSETMIENRMAKLRSRSFAEEVTAELGLALKLIPQKNHTFTRQEVFKTFYTTRSPIPGRYTLRFYSHGMVALYSEINRLDSTNVQHFIEDTVSYNGFSFSLQPDIIHKASSIVFEIQDFQSTVGFLLSRENLIPNGRTLMQISLVDTDPILASETINLLAGKFVQKSMELAKRSSQFNREYLEEQLRLVQKELNESDAELKRFRDTHIQNLDQETQELVARLNQLGDQINMLTLQKDELKRLLSNLDPASPNFKMDISVRYVYQQIVNLPLFADNAEMAITRQELNDRYANLDRMRGYPPTNPTVQQLNEEIAEIQIKINTLAQNKIKELETQLQQLQSQEQTLQNSLSKLPAEELRFIQLNRQRRANEVIYEALLRNYKEAQIAEAVASENISIIDPAIPPTQSITGDKKKKMLAGVLLGMVFGLAVSIGLEMMDRRIKSREDIKRYLKLPILGAIPKVKFDAYELQDSEKAKSISSQIVTHDYSPTPVGEAYRALRTSLLFSKTFGPIRSLVITSVAPGEGKSFTAANLAITLAQQKSKTLLIDADFRRGVLHNSFNCPKKPGLTNYLTGGASFESVLNETFVPNLTLMTCGSMVPNPSEMLGSERMQKFIEGITKRFDFIIFDTPPLLAASDAIILGTLVDGVALVIRTGETHRDDVQRKLELFQNVRAKVIGVIMNCAGVEVAHEGYSYYAY